MNINELAKAILEKLYRHGYIGAKHTSIDNVPKGFPKHRYGEIKKATKQLIKESFIMAKPTAYGLQISLNQRKMDEIKRIIHEP